MCVPQQSGRTGWVQAGGISPAPTGDAAARETPVIICTATDHPIKRFASALTSVEIPINQAACVLQPNTCCLLLCVAGICHGISGTDGVCCTQPGPHPSLQTESQRRPTGASYDPHGPEQGGISAWREPFCAARHLLRHFGCK